ncbi:putative adaptor complexes medium subunit family protein [Gregarina niphandrodes]|uniref:Adaptor complexes medium subunit family protein n=1 Tax=Gregarina niphandrodes TaxID=110365 RepID=A0A023BBU0_GRENI|nr:putative adaptor complexes medium subunit family protein [Gregarina niphandrodes]EZG79939.1 putative adaptor complexes medium subunit family protein [Gregarina niphandrodes]|eukprot:XP_011134358.1 putative adaptor complexes medium subunit family protein [Gregarina niphandrodes]
MIDSLFVIGPRGDAILQRTFRKRHIKNIGELLLKYIRRLGPSGGPVLNITECDTTFTYLKRSGLYFVLSMGNVAVPLSVCVDLLEGLVMMIKDVCGVLNEDNLRRNFLLLNEIVDEMFDYGIPVVQNTQQLTSSLCCQAISGGVQSAGLSSGDVVSRISDAAGFALTTFADHVSSITSKSLSVANQLGSQGSSLGSGVLGRSGSSLGGSATVGGNALGRCQSGSGGQMEGITGFGNVNFGKGATGGGPGPRTVPSNASQIPINKQGSAVLFIDIIDRLNAEVRATDGFVIRSSLDGTIMVKSYLSTPLKLKMGLNEDMFIDNEFYYQPPRRVRPEECTVVLDDCVFDECVDPEGLSEQSALVFTPPQGEFLLMKYRAQKYVLPFLLTASCTVLAPDRVEVVGRITQQSPGSHAIGMNGAISVAMDTPVYATVTNVALLNPTADKKQKVCIDKKRVVWNTRQAIDFSHDLGFSAKLTFSAHNTPAPLLAALRRNDLNTLHQYLCPFVVSFELPMHSSSRLQVRKFVSPLCFPPRCALLTPCINS